MSQSDIDDDVTAWHERILKQHAPVKTKRIKAKRLPKWYSIEIAQARQQRNYNKRKQNLTDYKRYRNLTNTLI